MADTVLVGEHAQGDFHQWVFLPGYKGWPVVEKRDSLGRYHRHAYRDWVVLICNNSECDARALVKADVLTDAAQRDFPVPTVEWDNMSTTFNGLSIGDIWEGEDEANCAGQSDDKFAFYCTRNAGHAGQHAASDGVRLLAIWGTP